MPLFYQHNINETTSLAVWQITEDENFFLQKIHLKKQINHPKKRLQHLAGRYLLQWLHPEFPVHLIEIAESNKPLLPDGPFNFSISHCGNFAAAIISKNNSAGIDVEQVTSKIQLIKNKFLSEDEMHFINQSTDQLIQLTILWSCKEAVYKWYGKGEVDFKKHIILKKIFTEKNERIVKCNFVKETARELFIHYKIFENLCLAWVIG